MVTAARPGITAAAELRGATGKNTNHTDESFLTATVTMVIKCNIQGVSVCVGVSFRHYACKVSQI